MCARAGPLLVVGNWNWPIAGSLGAGLAGTADVPVIAPVEDGATCDKFAATLRLLAFPCPSAGPRRKGRMRRNAARMGYVLIVVIICFFIWVVLFQFANSTGSEETDAMRHLREGM